MGSEQMRTIVHDRFMIGLPDGWQDASVVILAGPGEAGLRPTITVARKLLETPETSRSFGEAQLEGLADQLARDGFEVLEEEPVELGQVEAYRRVFRCTMADRSVTLVQMQVYLVREAEAYIICATDREEAFAANRPTFESAISGWRFIS